MQSTNQPMTQRYRLSFRSPGLLQRVVPDHPDLSVLRANLDQLARDASLQSLDVQGNLQPGCQVLQTLSRGRRAHTLVARLSAEALAKLKAMHGERLLVLSDEIELELQGLTPLHPLVVARRQALGVSVQIRVEDEAGSPQAGAAVVLEGVASNAEGKTDQEGRVHLTLDGESAESLMGISVRPKSPHWALVIEDPRFSDGVNRLVIRRFGGAPLESSEHVPWGIAAMGLEAAQAGMAPVKVAVIDTGIDGGHGDLLVAAEGMDFAESPSGPGTWRQDDQGHGTHVAGTVAAVANGSGVLGASAQGVDLISLRVFPRARMSKLIGAIDWAIEHDVDILNLSLGAPVDDPGMRDAVMAAHEAGVLLVAAAGNNGGPVLFPAAYAEVLAVAAVGKLESYPADSPHAGRESDTRGSDPSWYAANFTCRGPEVDVCAPGVGVVSTVPGGGYGAMDGTSMACPHIAGLAARLLATRSELHSLERSTARSNALAEALLESAADLGLPASIQGRGMPRLSAGPGRPETPEAPDEAPAHGPSRADRLLEDFVTLLQDRILDL